MICLINYAVLNIIVKMVGYESVIYIIMKYNI